jgi:predicted nucleotidyltransferase component of viral defense system
MIKTSRQLKDKIKNLSHGDSTKAQILTRKYMMERFLARVAASNYRDQFILKGGMLVSAIVGEEARSTMDIDATVRSLPLSEDYIKSVIANIVSLDLSDNLSFRIEDAKSIMEEHDYSGIRITMKVLLENLRETITVDISTGDAITPSAVRFSYPMMFEQGDINVWSYNLETLLAEKIETILARSTANTRMRDFYDIHILWNYENDYINTNILREAFDATAQKRHTDHLINDAKQILEDIENSTYMKRMWENYRRSNTYVGALEWEEALESVKSIVLDEIALTEGFELTMV